MTYQVLSIKFKSKQKMSDITVTARSTTGDRYEITLPSNSKVITLMTMIQQTSNGKYPTNILGIVFAARRIFEAVDKERTISDFGIKHNSTVFLVLSNTGNEAEEITFFVKNISGESHKMKMPASQKLIGVLKELEERSNKKYMVEHTILAYAGKNLSASQNGEQTLEEIGVYEKSSMIVVIRIPGGCL